jgi:predicted ATPase
MIKRKFIIENYRSIASELLELNHLSSEEDSMGGVVVIIGPNNSGKTNLLLALESFSSGKLSKIDAREVDGAASEDKIALSMTLTNGERNHTLSKKVNLTLYNGKPLDQLTNKQNPSLNNSKDSNLNHQKPISNSTNNIYLSLLEKMFLLADDYASFVYTDGDFNSLTLVIFNLQNSIQNNFFDNFKRNLETMFAILFKSISKLPNDFIESFKTIITDSQILLKDTENKEIKLEFIKKFWRPTASTESLSKPFSSDKPLLPRFLDPKIVFYSEKNYFKNVDLVFSEGETLNNSIFFSKLFSVFHHVKFKDLEDAYALYKFKKDQSKTTLKNFQNKLNKELDSISIDFNKIYRINNLPYRFQLDLESNGIYFIIYENETVISLESQSVGFQWFFNFYFKMYSANELKHGDIILLDEPATNLHVSGQIELLNFMRVFGLKNGILFILSTHSPFLIDVDFLEELRIVIKNESGTHITNKFNAIENNDSDLTGPIRTALTISANIMFELDSVVVFVEGITDYEYLLAFRNYLSQKSSVSLKSLKFIPIDGILEKNSNGILIPKKNIYLTLNRITRTPILLTDNDFAGDQFTNANRNSNMIFVSLREVNSTYKSIEDLFSLDDKNRFNITEKSSFLSKRFKLKSSLIETFSPSTISNFSRLFDIILNKQLTLFKKP